MDAHLQRLSNSKPQITDSCTATNIETSTRYEITCYEAASYFDSEKRNCQAQSIDVIQDSIVWQRQFNIRQDSLNQFQIQNCILDFQAGLFIINPESQLEVTLSSMNGDIVKVFTMLDDTVGEPQGTLRLEENSPNFQTGKGSILNQVEKILQSKESQLRNLQLNQSLPSLPESPPSLPNLTHLNTTKITAPSFSSPLQNVTMKQGEIKFISLPNVTSPIGTPNIKTSLQIPADLPPWIGLQDSMLVLTPSNTTEPGVFNVTIKVIDLLNPGQFTEGKFFITVIQAIKKATDTVANTIVKPILDKGKELIYIWSKILLKSPSSKVIPTITKITAWGEVYISFSQKMIVPPNFKKDIDSNALLLWIRNKDNWYVNLNWTVSDYSDKQLIIHLTFENTTSFETTDALNIQFIQNIHFSSLNLSNFIPFNTKISKPMPTMFKNPEDKKTLDTATTIVGSSMGSAFAASLVLQLFISYSMQTLWGMFNTLQFLVHVPLFNIQMPPNLSYFFGSLVTYLTFDVFSLIGLSEKVAEINSYEGDPLYPQFADVGYSSIYLIDNMGTVLFTFIIIPLLILMSLTLWLLQRRIKKIIGCIYTRLSKWLYFNPILRVILEAYLELSLATWIQLKCLQFDAPISSFQSIWAILLMILLVLYPLIIPLFLVKKRQSLEDQTFKEKFECLYEGCRTEQFPFLLQTYFFLSRRMFFVVLAVLINDSGIQTIIFYNLNLHYQIYIAYVRPYDSKKSNIIEVFNECTVMFVCYMLFIISDFVDDEDIKYMTGWLVVAVVLANFAINISIGLFETLRELYLTIKRCYHQRKKAKIEPINMLQNFEKKQSTPLKLHSIAECDFEEEEESKQSESNQGKLTSIINKSQDLVMEVLDEEVPNLNNQDQHIMIDKVTNGSSGYQYQRKHQTLPLAFEETKSMKGELINHGFGSIEEID